MTEQIGINDLLESDMSKNSVNIFVSFNGKTCSYEELHEKVNQVAGMLKHYNVNPADSIGIWVDNIDEFIICALASIKINTTYIPLAGTYPPLYINDILNACNVKHIIVKNNSYQYIDSRVNKILYEDIHNYSTQKGQDVFSINSPVSIFFEEGSSGIQERTVQSLQYIMNWFEFNTKVLNIRFDNVLFVYDTRTLVSFPTWLGSLMSCGKIFFYDISSDWSKLVNTINLDHISTMICPLNFIKNICRKNKYRSVFTKDNMSVISFGEEIFDANDFKKYIKANSIKWYNYFGFPQMFMVTTIIKNDESGKYTHTGRLSPNTSAFILDNSRQLTPENVYGDLFVIGEGALDNYQNELLNGQKFIQLPSLSTQMLLKTGYKACWLSDGKISIDDSDCDIARVGGIGVSVLRIEKALYSVSSIKDCSVVMRRRNGNVIYFTAFIVMDEDIDFEEIETSISRLLPKDILPLAYIRVPCIPRNFDGTVNYSSLDNSGLLDNSQLKELEGRITCDPRIDNAGLIVKRNFEKVLPYHIKNIFPQKALNSKYIDKDSNKIAEEKQSIEESCIDSIPLALVDGGAITFEDGEPETLSHILDRTVKSNGDKEIVFISYDKNTSKYTYSKLLEYSECILGGLRANGIKPGDKAILHFDKTEDYFCAFWACTLAGVIPVPIGVLKVYSKDNSDTRTIRNIWDMLEHPVILTSANLEPHLNGLYSDFRFICIENLKENKRDKCWHESSPEDTAIILFTSGSTGKPKGIIQPHKNILAREKSTTIFHKLNKDEISLNWLPVEHVVGVLMFHIKEVYLGCAQIHASTELILADPLLWLDLISQYKVTMTWAPNFAYGLVSDAIEKQGTRDWDLASIKLISNCGETVNGETTKKFLRLLQPFNLDQKSMKPEWGMSETCSCVMGAADFDSLPLSCVHTIDKSSMNGVLKDGSSETENVTFVDLGIPYPGTYFRVVDKNNKILRERVIGLLQVKGATVTPGYYQNPELNKEVFVGDGWFDTGDLGFIYKGRVTLTGRAKDVIIINGINYNNNEIEAIVEELDNVSVSYTVACTVTDWNGPEKLIIFFNTELTDFDEIVKLINNIRSTVIRQMGITPEYIIPVSKSEIPKTSIGKLQRAKLVKDFEKGLFSERIVDLEIRLANKNTVPAWFYKKAWRQKEASKDIGARYSNCCLVFEDDAGYSKSLVDRLINEGNNCIMVKPAECFKKVDYRNYEIRMSETQDYLRLLNEIEYTGHIDIFFTNIFEYHHKTKVSIEETSYCLHKGLYSLLVLLKALSVKHSMDGKIARLFVITENTQYLDGDLKISCESIGIGGFLRSANSELLWLKCCYIDLEAGNRGNNIESIIKEWKSIGHDVEVVIRNGKRYVPVLTRMNLEPQITQKSPLKDGGIYLITGGLGGIGLFLCKWLVENYNAKLVIVGRTRLPERSEWELILKQEGNVAKRIKSCIELESIKADFIYEVCDICDETSMKNVLKDTQSRWGEAISGVFHLAGSLNLEEHWKALDKHTITSECIDSFEETMKPKVYGVVQLHRLFESMPQVPFIVFSSVLGFSGSPTLSAYASANRFLEDFCYYRWSKGFYNTYCINWSTWHNTGMSENISSQMTKSNGFEVINPKQGLDSLSAILYRDPGSYFVGIDGENEKLEHIIENHSNSSQVLSIFYSIKSGENITSEEIRNIVSDSSPIYIGDKNMSLRVKRLDSLPIENGKVDRKKLCKLYAGINKKVGNFDTPETEVEKILFKIWSDLLDDKNFGVNESFFDIGGNSIKATSLIARIHKEMNVKLKLADIFTYPTIRKMSTLIDTSEEAIFAAIEKAQEKECYPLSPAQEGVYISSNLDKGSIAYNMTSVNILQGYIDKQKLEDCFKALIERHESLRTSFHLINGIPVQKINKIVSFNIEYFECSDEMNDKIVSSFIRPFDLTQSPLLRVALIQNASDKHLLVVDIHHIVVDGVSSFILLNELVALYDSRRSLHQMKYQYKDFSEWQHKMIHSEKMKQQEEYWLKEFSGNLPVLNIVTDFERKNVQDFNGRDILLKLDDEAYKKLKTVIVDTGTTLYMYLLAVCNILLSKYSNQEDIVVGTPVAGRNHADIENIIGILIEQLAIRNYPSKGKTFIELLEEVKGNVIRAFQNQDYQFNQLIEKLNLKKGLNRHPLYDVVFALEDRFSTIKIGDDLELIPCEHSNNTSKTDLRFGIIEDKDGISIKLTYCTGLFKHTTCQRMGEHFIEVLHQVLNDQNIYLEDISIVHRLKYSESGSDSNYSGDFDF